MQTATVFNVQKFSLDDGPGIRRGLPQGLPAALLLVLQPGEPAAPPAARMERPELRGLPGVPGGVPGDPRDRPRREAPR